MTKELTPEQIQENWKQLIQLVEDNFTGERLEKLLKMYDYFEERMCMAPASGKEHFHNAHAGGYVEHVIHVTTSALQIKDLWEKSGATINFTDEELIFAALHHDLGKVGDLSEDYYTPNDSDWHRKNQGLVYKHNGNLQFMTVTDRALFLLQHFGIKMSEIEYIGLMLTDGMYEEANKSYYVGYGADRSLKTNIAYILHQADMMATHIEADFWKRGDYAQKVVKKEEVKVKTKQSTAANQAFKELFGE
jgi:hypothetical protein|tara:strand:+ start:160 stop:903 length:744 start_codon:yes stop_codon:yes gene_type:complete